VLRPLMASDQPQAPPTLPAALPPHDSRQRPDTPPARHPSLQTRPENSGQNVKILMTKLR